MFEVNAKISVKKGNATVIAPIKEMIHQDLKAVPDDRVIHYNDVKEAYPEIAENLKSIFFTKTNKISVKDLKNEISQINPKDEKFWLSETEWKMNLQKILPSAQKVFQLNFTPEMITKIEADPAANKFFTAVFEKYKGSQHPLGDHTFAWARVYTLKDMWIVEEMQSDYVGWEKDFSSMTESLETFMKSVINVDETKQLQEFLVKHLGGWEKKFLATLVDMAKKAGAQKIIMLDEEVKKQYKISQSKAKHFYKNLPRDLGFKKEIARLGDKDLPVWNRVLGSLRERVLSKYKLLK